MFLTIPPWPCHQSPRPDSNQATRFLKQWRLILGALGQWQMLFTRQGRWQLFPWYCPKEPGESGESISFGHPLWSSSRESCPNQRTTLFGIQWSWPAPVDHNYSISHQAATPASSKQHLARRRQARKAAGSARKRRNAGRPGLPAKHARRGGRRGSTPGVHQAAQDHEKIRTREATKALQTSAPG